MEKVVQYYENYDEDGRLFRDNAHMIEYLTTIHYFDRLFAQGSRILDVCAGTGRYSFYLADKGHSVTACDLVEHNVNIIKSKLNVGKLTNVYICNALDLSRFEENSFDVVLCMGALYHLGSNDLKQKAVSECTRVCKPSGIVVLTYVTGSLIERLQNIFFCSTPCEIEEIATECGLKRKYNICAGGANSTAVNDADNLNEASNEDFQKYMERYYLICEDNSMLEAGGLGLWIGIKEK